MADRVDLKLFNPKKYDFFDIGFTEEGDFATTEGLDTALIISYHEELRANEDEVAQPELRRGWCGSEDNEFEQGSKLWLWEGSRRLQSVINGSQSDTLIGFDWLLDDGLADEITITNTFVNDGLRSELVIDSDGNDTEVVLYSLWRGTKAIGET